MRAFIKETSYFFLFVLLKINLHSWLEMKLSICHNVKETIILLLFEEGSCFVDKLFIYPAYINVHMLRQTYNQRWEFIKENKKTRTRPR